MGRRVQASLPLAAGARPWVGPLMLDFSFVRVGFVTQLYWNRYGSFWLELARSAGLDVVSAPVEGVKERYHQPELAEVPAVAFRLAAAQAAALLDSGAEAVVVPRIARESEVARGSGQDPWVMDLEGSLRATLPALTGLVSVPSWFGDDTDPSAVAFLQRLGHEPALLRRTLERVRPLARPGRPAGTDLTLTPAAGKVVALVGQPWLVSPELERLAAADGERVMGQQRLDPEELREEGHRADARLVDPDAESLGATRLLGRRAAVGRLRIVVDEGSLSDAWLAKRLARAAHKPVETRSLRELLADQDPVDVLLRPQLD